MIFYRHLYKELLFSFLATFVILVLIVVGSQYLRLLDRVNDAELALEQVESILFFNTAIMQLKMIPATLFISMMMVFTRMHNQSEMVAFRACGLSPKHFIKGISLFIFPFVLLLTYLVLISLPKMELEVQRIKESSAEINLATKLNPGTFSSFNQNGVARTAFVENQQNQSTDDFSGLFFHQKNDAEESILLSQDVNIKTDPHSNASFFQFSQGHRYQFDQNTGEVYVVKYRTHGIKINQDRSSNDIIQANIYSTPSIELLRSSKPEHQAELQYRLSIIIACLTLAFLAFPLCYSAPRKTGIGTLPIGVLIYILYSNGISTMKHFIANERIAPWLGMPLIHLMVIALALWLLHKHYSKPQ